MGWAGSRLYEDHLTELKLGQADIEAFCTFISSRSNGESDHGITQIFGLTLENEAFEKFEEEKADEEDEEDEEEEGNE